MCKPAFSYFDKASEANLQILVDCCDALLDLMESKRHLLRYEPAFESQILNAISKQPFRALVQLIIKFVGLASTHFNSSRLIRKVLLACDFTTSQQIGPMYPMIRHRSFEKYSAQIIIDVLLSRTRDALVDDDTLRFLARLILVRQPPSSLGVTEEPTNSSLICLSLASGYHSPEALQETVQWITQPLSDS